MSLRIPFPAVILVGALVIAATPAWAHAILMASSPAAGSSVAPGRVHLLLRFNSRVDHARSSLVLTPPQGAPERLSIDPSSAVDTLSAAASLPPGTYSVRWQVLAIDGHITRGDVPFSVTPSGIPPATSPGAPADAPPGRQAGTPRPGGGG